MDITSIITIIVAVVTIIGVLGGFMFHQFNKLDSDIKSSIARIDVQMTRIDKLYCMFVDLLKKEKK